MRWIAAVLLCLCALLSAGHCRAQAPDQRVLAEAQGLLRGGKAEQAWQLLFPLEQRHAGEPDFDYLLGIAALESGRPERATFVLERVIVANPGHMAARLENARAYFALRDFERAQREFELILRTAPPAETRALIQTYLARMRDPAQPEGARVSGYAEVAAGRDSNVSAAAAVNSVFIPGQATEFTPDPLFQRRPDRFWALAAGVEYADALRPGLDMTAGGDFQQRWHDSLDAFDSRVADLHVNLVQRLDERDRVEYVARYNNYELDNTRYREMGSLGSQWSRSLGPRTRIAASAQGLRIRYASESNQASDSDLLVGVLSTTHLLSGSSRTLAAAGVVLGNDNAVAGRADGDRRIYGMNFGAQRQLRARMQGYVRYSLLNSDYATQNADFGITRRDRQRDLSIGLAWEFASGWLLRPQITDIANRSNLPLNEYQRTEASITLRRVWD
jgi:tetratricopeptide (TPR) repeat protein